MTRLTSSGSYLAIGYSLGYILVYDLDMGQMEDSRFPLIHKFNLHKSGISAIIFSENNTMMYSGGQDSYIVVYDLVSDHATFKLQGHKDAVSQMQLIKV